MSNVVPFPSTRRGKRPALIPASYEVEVVHPDGRRAFLAFVRRQSFAALNRAMDYHRFEIMDFLGLTVDARMTTSLTATAYHLTGGGLVRFSGRTEHEVVYGTAPPLPCVTTFARS
jgi:hypothetical protein